MNLELTSETSAHKILTPGKHPKVRIQHSEHGASLNSRIGSICYNKSTKQKVWHNADA